MSERWKITDEQIDAVSERQPQIHRSDIANAIEEAVRLGFVSRTASDIAAERTHELKTWPQYFSAILAGHKTFELRRNDRDFNVGDLLILKEYDPDTCQYSGRWITRRVSIMLTTFPGLVEGYVCMGWLPS